MCARTSLTSSSFVMCLSSRWLMLDGSSVRYHLRLQAMLRFNMSQRFAHTVQLCESLPESDVTGQPASLHLPKCMLMRIGSAHLSSSGSSSLPLRLLAASSADV